MNIYSACVGVLTRICVQTERQWADAEAQALRDTVQALKRFGLSFCIFSPRKFENISQHRELHELSAQLIKLKTNENEVIKSLEHKLAETSLLLQQSTAQVIQHQVKIFKPNCFLYLLVDLARSSCRERLMTSKASWC
jgi:hypothetical protein